MEISEEMAKTEYSLWKSVLLDWVSIESRRSTVKYMLKRAHDALQVNSTGFLVKNHEDLNETNIEKFYQGFKQQIKSTKIESADAVRFVKGEIILL